MVETFKAAQAHKGTSFVEVFKIVLSLITRHLIQLGRDVRSDQVMVLEEGKPLVYGEDGSKGIKLNSLNLESGI